MKDITTVYSGNVQPYPDTLREIWEYRNLLWMFAIRDVKTRYSKTTLGLIWVVLTPLITVGVFTLVFGLMIKIPSDGLPYLVFYLVAIVPWYAFVKAANQTITSIDGSASILTKVYFPRMLISGSYALSASFDYVVGFVLINIVAVLYGLWNLKILLFFPFALYILFGLALGAGLLLAPLNTRYRDVSQFTPLAMQFFYFCNPILYPVSAAPDWLKPWFDINPFSVVISTFRRCVRDEWPEWHAFFAAMAISTAFLVIGSYYFNKRDRDLVDLL